MVGPTVNVGSYPMKINVRITALRHAQKNRLERFERPGDDRQLFCDDFCSIVGDGMLRGWNGGESRRRCGLDGDMNQDEPPKKF